MDLRFSPELEQWRAEVRDFLKRECPPELCFDPRSEKDAGRWEPVLDFNRRLGKTGWVGVNWPTQYGGLGRPHIYRSIMMQEIRSYGAPILNSTGWGFAAGLLLKFGSEQQKQRFLPAIIQFETFWAEGLTEPDAGSDLASLQTTAVRDGDNWVINGQKTFITWAHRADVLYLAARTDPHVPRHRGISTFCLPLKSPGISLRLMPNLEGGAQNHVHMDNVRVPLDMLLGEENKGWNYVMNGFYGGAGAQDTGMERVFQHLVEYCKTTRRHGRLLSQDPIVRNKLAELAIGLETLKLISWDGLYRTEHRIAPELGGAVGAIVLKEFQPRFAQICMEVLGPLGQIQGGPWSPLAGEVEHLFRTSFKTHAGGTAQVKRMVLATRGLGLPR